MLRKLVCPGCGGPLPSIAAMAREATCTYCGLSFAVGPAVVNARDFRAAREGAERDAELSMGPLVRVAGTLYRPLGRIARGESTDVHLGERACPTTERVILKVLRARQDADLFAREHETLLALSASHAAGTSELSRRISQPVARGVLSSDEAVPVLVMRYLPGYYLTLADVGRAHPQGAPPEAIAWMWRRILEALTWVHASGFAHRAIVPPHLLVHPRDHGVMLVGWSSAARIGERSVAYPAEYADVVPTGDVEDPGTRSDLVMAARCMVLAAGGDRETWTVPSRVPRPLAKLLEDGASNRSAAKDAWTLRSAVGVAAEESFGPPRYYPFVMPGWTE
jgi:serine/threonine protein kinase